MNDTVNELEIKAPRASWVKFPVFPAGSTRPSSTGPVPYAAWLRGIALALAPRSVEVPWLTAKQSTKVLRALSPLVLAVWLDGRPIIEAPCLCYPPYPPVMGTRGFGISPDQERQLLLPVHLKPDHAVSGAISYPHVDDYYRASDCLLKVGYELDLCLWVEADLKWER